MPRPDDLHEWVSFDDDEEDRTWVFDVTFLTSNWTCIFGQGCQGVFTGPTPELEHGCCSYGAHFTGPEDIAHLEEMAQRLTADDWQNKAEASRLGSVITTNDDGDTTTQIVDDACIFLNHPGWPGGAGCALHQAALKHGERPLDWKPEVCWQLPLRLEEDTDGYGHITATLREWKRRDWGAGGFEFHWWCTDDPDAFVGRRPVYEELRDEIIELVGERPYEQVVTHLKKRRKKLGKETWVPHPAVRKR